MARCSIGICRGLAGMWALLLLTAGVLPAQIFQLRSKQAGLERSFFGHGVAAADYDNDGWIDFYLVTRTPTNPNLAGSENLLFRNNGNGTFTNVAREAGVVGIIDSTIEAENRIILNYGASWGDFDNDGDVDLYLTNKGLDEFYENLGDGKFRLITRQAGLAIHRRESSTAVWFDYDRDGHLDLYVGAYGKYGIVRVSDNVLYRNNGDGTFADVTAQAGVGDPGWTYSAMVLDANFDGWPDLYVVNDFGANVFYLNKGDGTFREATREYGLENDGHGMGVTLGDVNGDGLFDLYFTNIADDLDLEWSPLFLHAGNGTYRDISRQSGTGITNWAWGCEFFDYDLDGLLDLYVVNGNLGNNYPNRLYRNTGGGIFEDISAGSGTDNLTEARGLVVADFTNNGRLDMVVANWREPADIYFNMTEGGNYLKVNLVGTQSNRDAYGATVMVEAGGRRFHRPNNGIEFLGQSKLPIHFGLGEAQTVSGIEVSWPSGQSERTGSGIPANQTITIVEGQGIVTSIAASPAPPQEFRLLASYPNPLREFTSIRFQAEIAAELSIVVYDLLGREVATIASQQFAAGSHTLRWNARDGQDRIVPAGVYLVQVQGRNFSDQQKIIVLK